MPKLIAEQQKTAFDSLKKDFGWTNRMQAPRIEKVVISVGVGKMLKDKGKVELVADRLAKITGQKPASRGAKKAISTYKTRVGDKIGYQITLRGKRVKHQKPRKAGQAGQIIEKFHPIHASKVAKKN